MAKSLHDASERAPADRQMVARTRRFHLAGDGVLRRVSKAAELVRRNGLRMAHGRKAGAGRILGIVVEQGSKGAVGGAAREIRAPMLSAHSAPTPSSLRYFPAD